MKIIGVACGGYTSEREISLKSGSFIFNLICDANFECYKIEINKSNCFVIDKLGNKFSLNKKNFQLIGGLELWKHLIYELNELGSEIYIDTDSTRVINDCNVDSKLSNVIAYPRKKQYIEIENDPDNDLSPANLMLENFLDTYVTDEDEIIVLTHVTSPFLKKETIKSVVEKYREGDFEYIHSVNKEKDFGFLESL